jgi:acyl-CoA thioesterase-2
MRVSGPLAGDPVVHQAAFTYASDMTLLGATLIPHQLLIGTAGMQAASLDHTIWFQRPFRADDWWLYDQHSPAASGGRGLALARVFTPDGTLVANVAQEGLIRYRSDPEA